MGLKFNGKKISAIRVGTVKAGSVYFGGKKVWSGSLPVGTVLFENTNLVEIPTGKKTEISLTGVKSDLTNISSMVKVSGKWVGKTFSKTVSREDLIRGVTLYYSLRAILVPGTNKLSFTYDDGDNGIGIKKIELV